MSMSWPRRETVLKVFAAFIVFLALSLVFWMPSGSWSTHMVGNSGGFGGNGTYVWTLQWWPYAIVHGLNPFMENYTLFPFTQDVAWATVGMAVPAIILAPVTLTFGPIVSYNILSLLAAPVAAVTMFSVLWYLTHDWIASWLGAFFFGFSSYMLGQLMGQPNLFLVFPMPLAVLLALMFLDKRIQRHTFVLGLAGLLVVQFGISLETFASMTVFGVVTWVVAYLVFRGNHKEELKRLVLPVVLAYAACCVVISPFLYYLVIGVGQIPSTFNPPALYSADLLNYIIPTPLTVVGGAALAHLSLTFSGVYAEAGAYIGAPALLLAAIYVIRGWQTPVVRLLAILFVLFVGASLGPLIHVAGIVVGRGPWDIVSAVPLLREALPIRFTVFVSMTLAVMVGLFVVRYKSHWASYALAVVAAACLLPSLGHGYWQSNAVQSSLFTSGRYARYINRGSSVMVLPFSYYGSGMFYQATTDFAFRLNDGFIGYNPKEIFRWPLLVQTLYDQIKPLPGFQREMMCYLYSTKVDYVVVEGAQAEGTYDSSLRALSPLVGGDEQLFAVPKGLASTYAGCKPTALSKVVKLLQANGAQPQ